MDDDLAQAYARLGMHEWALEAMMTTFLRSLPHEDAAAWLDQWEDASSRICARDNVAPGDIEATRLSNDQRELTSAFAEKVRRRIAS